MLVVLSALLMFQEPETKSLTRPVPNGTSPAMVTATSARAVLAPRTPAIDGRDDDEVWEPPPPQDSTIAPNRIGTTTARTAA